MGERGGGGRGGRYIVKQPFGNVSDIAKSPFL